MDKTAEEVYEKMFELREEKTFDEYHKRGIELLEQYAQQGQRKAFFKGIAYYFNLEVYWDAKAEQFFNKWIKNQQ